MKNKKLIVIIGLVIAIIAGSVAGLLIGLTTGNGEQSSLADSSSVINPDDIIWVDSTAPNPEPDPEVSSPMVSYPEKPAQAPVIDSTVPTTIGTVTASDECYTLTQETNGLKVAYDAGYETLPAFAYLWAPVENFQSKYSYLKIKADCQGVDRISIIAVYYEQYDAKRPGVTVYNNSVLTGENVIICNLDDGVVLDKFYNVAMGEKVTQKTVIGFMIMIDSNPKQLISDSTGEMLITNLSLVDSSDEDISLLSSAPVISGWSTTSTEYTDYDISTKKSETTGSLNAILDYSFTGGYPFFVASIHNYKSEYTTLKMRLKGASVKNVSIAIAHALSTSSTNAPYNYLTYNLKITNEFELYEFDFSNLEELISFEGDATVPGSYIKNLKPTAIYFYIDTADLATGGTGTLYVEDMEFLKVVDDGIPKVTATWAVTGNNITKKDVTAGGIGTLTYTETQGWTPVTLSVSSYTSEYSVLVIKVKFYNGADNLGVALNDGGWGVIQNSDGNNDTNAVINHTSETGNDDKGEYVFHTYEIDFTNVQTSSLGALKDQPINKILLYIDAKIMFNGSYIDGTQTLSTPRIMQFVGIEFKKPTANA